METELTLKPVKNIQNAELLLSEGIDIFGK